MSKKMKKEKPIKYSNKVHKEKVRQLAEQLNCLSSKKNFDKMWRRNHDKLFELLLDAVRNHDFDQSLLQYVAHLYRVDNSLQSIKSNHRVICMGIISVMFSLVAIVFTLLRVMGLI